MGRPARPRAATPEHRAERHFCFREVRVPIRTAAADQIPLWGKLELAARSVLNFVARRGFSISELSIQFCVSSQLWHWSQFGNNYGKHGARERSIAPAIHQKN